MVHKALIIFVSFLTMTTCAQAQKINSDVYKCISNDPEYSNRCKLVDAKEIYQKKEIENYFHEMGSSGGFTKEIPKYAKNFITNSELYCSMEISHSFIDVPKNNNIIMEKTAECLISQYQQLGINLKKITAIASKITTERVVRDIEAKRRN